MKVYQTGGLTKKSKDQRKLKKPIKKSKQPQKKQYMLKFKNANKNYSNGSMKKKVKMLLKINKVKKKTQ